MRIYCTALLAMALVCPSPADAQSDADALAQKAANPIANMISVPFQLNNDFGLGTYDRTRNVLNIQPVVPLMGGRIITRTILPFVWLPDLTQDSGMSASGLSDTTLTAFYVPSSGATMWGVGPVIEMPTGGAERGSQKWSIGPSAVALTVQGPWTLGVLANQVWSVAGNADRDAVSRGLLQYIIVRQLGNGWYLNSVPIITVDWQAASGDQWTIPFGIGGGKLQFFGKLPVNLQAGFYYNVAKPDIGPAWQLRLQAQLLLPTPGSD